MFFLFFILCFLYVIFYLILICLNYKLLVFSLLGDCFDQTSYETFGIKKAQDLRHFMELV